MQYALTCFSMFQLSPIANMQMNEVSTTKGKLMPSVPIK